VWSPPSHHPDSYDETLAANANTVCSKPIPNMHILQSSSNHLDLSILSDVFVVKIAHASILVFAHDSQVISPGRRIGTLDGELCLTDMRLVGMVRMCVEEDEEDDDKGGEGIW
jgi:hypothetical protein